MYRIWHWIISIKPLSSDIDQTFSDISVMIVTMMALTAIVFAQYYDKSSERSREILWEVREKYTNQGDVEDVIVSFRKLAFVGGLRRHFSVTFWMFSIISTVLGLLWVYKFIGEMHNQHTRSDGMVVGTDLVLFLGLLVTLIYVFSSLNSHQRSIKLTENGFRLASAFNVISSMFGMQENEFLSGFLKPSLSITTDTPEVGVIFQHLVPANGYQIVWEIRTSENRTYAFTLSPNHTNELALPRYLSSTANLSRIYSDLSNYSSTDSRVYLKMKGIKRTFIGEVTCHQEGGQICFQCHNFASSSPSGGTKALLRKSCANVYLTTEGTRKGFKLGKPDGRHRINLQNVPTTRVGNNSSNEHTVL